MTITLPANEDQHVAYCRVLVRPSWSTGKWQALPMLPRSHLAKGGNGYRVRRFRRTTLPEVGDAEFRYQYGRIDDDLYDTNASSMTSGAYDLTSYEIRIQVAPPPSDAQVQSGAGFTAGDNHNEFAPAWVTQWWGTCEYFVDRVMPGSTYAIGERIYFCVDGFARKRQRPLAIHGSYASGTQIPKAMGHPGYNVSRGWGVLQGNKEPTAVSSSLYADEDTATVPAYLYHTHPGAGSKWTDAEAITNADLLSRSHGDPVFTLAGSTELLSGTFAWPVAEDENAFDFIARILRRQRGRGVAFLDFTDVGAPDGKLVPVLRVCPQTYADIVYTKPSDGSSVTLPGALTAGTYVDVDLKGDHRNVSSTFQIGSRNQHRVDYLESLGEPIQVVATFGYPDGTIEKRWTTAEETAFAAISTDRLKAVDEKWDHVWHVHRLIAGWGGLAKDGNTGTTVTTHRIDYRCADDGSLIAPDALPNDTSPLTVRFLASLPMFEGYTYAVAPPHRWDGSETTQPERRKPLLLLRNASDRYVHAKDVGATMAVSENEIEVRVPSEAIGTRAIGDKSVTSLHSLYDMASLVVTLGMELPHHARMASGNASGARRMRIVHPNIHLWLASPGAVWDVDATTRNANGSTPRRAAAGATLTAPGILRDDRDGLAQVHALAWAWYGAERTTAKWQIRGCGMLPSFTDASGAPHAYAKVGQVVGNLSASGIDWVIRTPVTSIEYDVETDTTTWVTDWQDLDFSDARHAFDA